MANKQGTLPGLKKLSVKKTGNRKKRIVPLTKAGEKKQPLRSK